MIVQALLEIQQRYGYLPQEELEFLALRARDYEGKPVPLYRIQEVSSFFPHFRREAPAKVSLHICQSMTCHLRGAPALLQEARRLAGQLGPENLEVHGVSCLGRCDRAPCALLGQHSHEGNGSGHHEMLFCDLGTRHAVPTLIADAAAGKKLSPDHD